MKHFISILFTIFFSFTLFAQEDVTKFLGIPVDGYKNEMRRKLEAKGYTWNSYKECLEGEFNGTDVNISIVTNNNKVYRIFVQDAYPRSEADIKIRFNRLCQQFEKNKKYSSLGDSQVISEDEDISYEMSVHSKRYEAAYFQNPEQMDTLKMQAAMLEKMTNEIPAQELENPTEETQQKILRLTMEYAFEYLSNKQVWFMIDGSADRYRILMYYDNKYNQADGEDL